VLKKIISIILALALLAALAGCGQTGGGASAAGPVQTAAASAGLPEPSEEELQAALDLGLPLLHDPAEPDGPISFEEYSVELIMAELRQEGRERVQLNVPIVNYVEGQVFPTFRVEDDGTLVNLTGHILDGATLYKNYIQKFVECAERNHVGFLETEIGTDTTVLSVEEYLAYHTMWLDMMREHHIGWMYNCERNIFAPKDLMWLNGTNNPIPFERFSLWEDGPYWINDDVMELLKAYQ